MTNATAPHDDECWNQAIAAGEAPYADPQDESKNLFELLVDYVRAQREAPPSDKWYGDWDDTYLQYNALNKELGRHSRMSPDELDDQFAKFRDLTSHHLWACPLVSAVTDHRLPALGPLTRDEAAGLRATAANLRTPEGGARPSLTYMANEALAALYDAHATLGEVLWDEDGGTHLHEHGLFTPLVD